MVVSPWQIAHSGLLNTASTVITSFGKGRRGKGRPMNPNAMEFWKITAGIWLVALLIMNLKGSDAGLWFGGVATAIVFIIYLKNDR